MNPIVFLFAIVASAQMAGFPYIPTGEVAPVKDIAPEVDVGTEL
jgi:hypothetical protein